MFLFLFTLSIILLQTSVLSVTNCTGIKCDGPSSLCPSDSTLSSNGTCKCDKTLCKQPPICYDEQMQLLVKAATDVPGECCDIHECVDKPEKNCSLVQCPKETERCPSDSYELPKDGHVGDCCGKPMGCQCLPSACSEQPSCLDGEVPMVVRVGNGTPGTCCPIYQCVSSNSHEHCENGTTWINLDCEKCTCDRGIKFCATIECPKLSDRCIRTEKPKSQCCPVCVDESVIGVDNAESTTCLLDDGNTLLHVGDTFNQDPCTNCICQRGGQTQCTASMCEVTCVNPKYVDGQCCPICDSANSVVLPPTCPRLTDCKLRCKGGFVKTSDGCLTCECQEEVCVLECPEGYQKDQRGNDLCECAPPSEEVTCPPLSNCLKECPHGYRRKNGCEICRCAQCPSLNDCDKKCSNGFQLDENGCRLCKCQPRSTDKNTACYTSDGTWRDDMEYWKDNCRECHCIEGREMCTVVACPIINCEHPLPPNSTQCCPHCPGSSDTYEASACMDFHGEIKLEGQHWTMNDCTDCTCKEGKVLCYSQRCPPAACSNPIQPEAGNCCPRCTDSNEITALVISDDSGNADCGDKKNGSSWRESNCVSCRCESGHKICYQQECPRTNCIKSVELKNSCCPICLDNITFDPHKGCRVGNITYIEEQEWVVDECTTCVCRGGSQLCTKRECIAGSCMKSEKVRNECCPVCLDEEKSVIVNHSNEHSTTKQIKETLYILLIVLFCVSTMFALYACRQLRVRRTQLPLGPPPQYQYKYIPTFDGPNTRIKTTSCDEKMSLAPV